MFAESYFACVGMCARREASKRALDVALTAFGETHLDFRSDASLWRPKTGLFLVLGALYRAWVSTRCRGTQ